MDGHHGQTGESAWGRVVFKVSSGRSAAQTIQPSVVKGKHAEEFTGRLAGMQSPSTELFPWARTSLIVYGIPHIILILQHDTSFFFKSHIVNELHCLLALCMYFNVQVSDRAM